MPVYADTDQSTRLDVGDEWVIAVLTEDDDGLPAAATVAILVTLPDGTTSAVTPVQAPTGTWTGRHTVTAAGRHLAVVTASGDTIGVVPFTTWAQDPTADGLPDTSACMTYLGETSATDAEVLDALTAEAAAQRSRCKIPPNYPADLRQALLRRVARNLALRGLPLAVLQGDAESGSMVLPGSDPEVRRFEAPHRKKKVG